METDKRKLRDRSIIFTISAISIFIILVFDLFFSFQLSILSSVRDESAGTAWNWMMFWTHLSVMGSFVWITFALGASITKSEKWEGRVQSWIWKNLTFTFILVTGLVFVTAAYFPTLYIFIFGEGVKGHDESGWYDFMVVLGTTLKHVVIPGMFLYLALTDVGYSEESKLNKWEKSMTLFMFPCLYLVYVVVFASCGLADAPYPVVNFEFNPPFGETEIHQISIWVALAYVACDIFVGFLFVMISLLQFNLEEKKKEKELVE